MHAIAQGMGNNGIDITKRIEDFLPKQYISLFVGLESGDRKMIIQELLCRGFQRMTFENYLDDTLNLSVEDRKKLIQQYYQNERQKSSEVLFVIGSLYKTGLSFEQLLGMQRRVNAYYKFQTDVRLDPDLRSWFKYDLEPFDSQTVRYILKRQKGPLVDFFERSLLHARILFESLPSPIGKNNNPSHQQRQ